METTALFSLTYGLYIVSAKENNKINGCTVNTVMQITAEPEQLITVIHKKSLTHDMILRTERFNVSILAKDTPLETLALFGFRSGRDTDKFAKLPFDIDDAGIPYLRRNSVAMLSCRVIRTVDVGTHTLFVAQIDEDTVLDDREPLDYTFYRREKNGKVPQEASSFHAAPPHSTVYRCSVCGYLYEGAHLPPEFHCPVCGQSSAVFEKQNRPAASSTRTSVREI